MSSPLPSAVTPLKDQARHLAWKHCWLHWRMGMVLLVPGMLACFILAPLFRYQPVAPPGIPEMAGTLLALGTALGASAAVFGMLRVLLMQRLFQWALRRPANGRTGLLLGSALIFWGPIGPLYLLLLLTADDASGTAAESGVLFLLVPSTPWLISHVWATWKLWTQAQATSRAG